MKKVTHYAWPTTKEESEHMRMRQIQNKIVSKFNSAENLVFDYLKTTDYKWTRQAIWGVRLFDFWCGKLGIAIEVDGEEHDSKRDFGRDRVDFKVSGIVVIRVRNYNIDDIKKALLKVKSSENWNERRASLGLKLITNI